MKTTHNLDFECAPWEPLPGLPYAADYQRFRIGTCEGLWSSDKSNYIILAIENSCPGNGHLKDVFEWFENSCKRDKKDLLVMEIMNENFKRHLITKCKFRPYGTDHAIKKLKDMK